MTWRFVVTSFAVLSACVVPREEAVLAAPEDVPPQMAAPAPPPEARRVEEFDTTTEAQRVAAATPSSTGALLGEAVVTLGDPGRAGFWVETALVDAQSNGRVELRDGSKSVDVVLFPDDGGGRMSLAALRLLDAPLTALVEVNIYEYQ